MRFALPLLLIVVAHCAAARAAVDGIAVILESGEVVGATYGVGEATVAARVTNSSGRTVLGIRLAAWYSAADVLPPADADWRIHEFVFEPPLAPGGTSTLTFSDQRAAQYVMLEARAVKFRAALRIDGATHDLQHPPLRRGEVTYIALRDLVEVAGGRLGSRDGFIVIERFGNMLRLKAGSAQAEVDGKSRQLANPVIEEAGRSFIALGDAAGLLELELAELGDELWELR